MKKFVFCILICAAFVANAQVQTEYYPNGKKSSEGNYTIGGNPGVVMASDGSSRPAPNQKKEGLWTYWYDSGVKSSEEMLIYLN